MKNLVIFMADALRADYFPDLKGTTVKTICQGVNTPTNFTAMLSGVSPQKHGVQFFTNQSCQVPTVLDLPDYDTSYYDHPDDPMYKILNNPPRKELEDMEEPFVYVERETSTHVIYGRNWRLDDVTIRKSKDGRAYSDMDGKEYIQRMREDKVDYIEDYEEGVEIAKKRLLELVDKLKDMGVYDDTLIIMTADHGEAFPEDGRKGIIHNVVCPEVINVKTCFYDRDLDVEEPIKTVDIIRVWRDNIMEKLEKIEIESEDIKKEAPTDTKLPEQEEKEVKDRLEKLGYK